MKASIVEGTISSGGQPGAFLLTTDPENFIHFCPRCAKGMSIWFGARGRGHQLVSRDPLTVQGSIICPRSCGAHYFVTNGAIVMAGDALP